MLESADTVLIATRNKGKIAEFARMFSELGKQVRSLNDYDEMPEIIEDGDTFRANAMIKAWAMARHFGLPALADDSGLCVARLNGQPGVYSARFAGEGAADRENNELLLRRLRELPAEAAASTAGSARSAAQAAPVASAVDGARLLSPASFVSGLALVNPGTGEELYAEGSCAGFIIGSPKGDGGFGYDPLFYLPEYARTMAELTMAEKNAVSHRGMAVKQLLHLLQGRTF